MAQYVPHLRIRHRLARCSPKTKRVLNVSLPKPIKYRPNHGRPTRSSRATHRPRHGVRLPADTFEIGKCILILYLAKLRHKVEDILETHELFIYEDIHGITSSFCKQLLKQPHPSLGFELHYFVNCSCCYQYIFNADRHIKGKGVP